MKGILFKPWKIVYIAEHPDIEIQTRRVIQIKNTVKTEDCTTNFNYQIAQAPDKSLTAFWTFRLAWEVAGIKRSDFTTIRCPYQQGETVYIKEKWALDKQLDKYLLNGEYKTPIYYREDSDLIFRGRWRSTLFMPEWAARYFITITDVRAERLQEITEDDCYKEGLSLPIGMSLGTPTWAVIDTLRFHFKELWNSINKDYPWESNPWVWVYTFRREE